LLLLTVIVFWMQNYVGFSNAQWLSGFFLLQMYGQEWLAGTKSGKEAPFLSKIKKKD